MKPSDWFLDLQDLLGKLLPGLIILIEVIFLYKYCNLTAQEPDKACNLSDILNFFFRKDINAFAWIPVVISVSAICYIVGYFSTYATFRLVRNPLSWLYRRICIRQKINNLPSRKGKPKWSNLESFLALMDKTGKIWERTFKDEFNEKNKEGKEINYWELRPYYKNFLAELSPQSFLLLKKEEANINFFAGMTIPLLLLCYIIISYKSTFSNSLLALGLFFLMALIQALVMLVLGFFIFKAKKNELVSFILKAMKNKLYLLGAGFITWTSLSTIFILLVLSLNNWNSSILILVLFILSLNVWAMLDATEKENYLTFILYHSALRKSDTSFKIKKF